MNKPRFIACALSACVLAAPAVARAQSAEIREADHKLMEAEKQDSQLMANLEYLSDMIGPRLTGSERLRKANEWTAQKMREYGLDNVHLESWTIPIGWERGRCEAKIVEPNGLPVSCAAWAWGPNTKGTITGPVVWFDPKDDNDFDRFKGKLKNAIIMTVKPSTPDEHPSRSRPRGGMFGTDQTAEARARQQQQNKRMEFLKREGAAVWLLDSNKPQMLLNMTGEWDDKTPVTRLFVANEHYSMLYRLLQRHIPVTMQVHSEGKFIKGPITVSNTIGEIRGTEKPDEVVICGGHLDSWDLGQGTTDNGTGSMVVLETARLLKASGLKPKRTLRFILFTGEEQGLWGSREYVKAHRDEMSKISAVYIHDTGTGKVTGIGLHGSTQVQPVLEKELAILKDELGVTGWSSFLMGGTDHASFYDAGVPGFWYMQDSADYGWTHHSQSDTFDKALKDDLIQGATVMAICAYNTAQLPDMLPRKGAASK